MKTIILAGAKERKDDYIESEVYIEGNDIEVFSSMLGLLEYIYNDPKLSVMFSKALQLVVEEKVGVSLKS